MNNNEKLAAIVSMIEEKANTTAHTALKNYSAAHSDALVDVEVRDLVIQRAHSELMLRMCAFKPAEDIDSDGLKESFENWFATEEEKALAQMCDSMIEEETKKRLVKGDQNLTFTERYKKKVREEHPTAATLNKMIND